MLFVHVGKSSSETLRSSRSQTYFKIGVLKNFSMFAKTPVFESLFNKAEDLNACIFIKKVFPCEYCKTFENSLLVEYFLFIILSLNSLDVFGCKIDVFYISCTIAVFLHNSSVRIETPWLFRTYFYIKIFSKCNFRRHSNVGSSIILIESLKTRNNCRTLATSPSNLL